MARPATLDASRLLAALSGNVVSPTALAQTLGVSRATLHRKLDELKRDGLVIREGEGPRAGYRLPTVDESLARAKQEQADAGQVRLVLTPAQAYATREALELYARVGIGQLRELASRSTLFGWKRSDGSELSDAELDQAEGLTSSLARHLMNLAPHSSFGIHAPQVSDTAQVAWAMNHAIRHRLAWDRNPEGSMGVWHDEPLSGDMLQHFFVHSDQSAEKEASVYVVEMAEAQALVLGRVLDLAIRVGSGDFEAVVELAAAGELPWYDGGKADATSLDIGGQVARRLRQLVHGSDTPEQILRLSKLLVRQAAVRATLHDVLGETPSNLEQQARVLCEGPLPQATRETSSRFAVAVNELPEGLLLNYHQGRYRVIGPAGDGQHLAILADSHSWQTALCMARNLATGNRARNFGF